MNEDDKQEDIENAIDEVIYKHGDPDFRDLIAENA